MYYRKRQALTNYRAGVQKRRKTSRPYSSSQLGYVPRNFSLGEWKYLDTGLGTLTMNTTPVLLLLNGLAPGNSASQRIGMKVAIRTLELRARVATTAGTGVDQTCRWLIFVDRQSNGVAPTAGDVLTGNLDTFRNLANRKRFKIILDRHFPLSASAENGSIRVFHAYLKFRRPLLVEFNTGTAGTVADITSGAIYIMVLGNIASGTTDANMNGTVRFRYTDM